MPMVFMLLPFDAIAIALALTDWKRDKSSTATSAIQAVPHKAWRIYFNFLIVIILIGGIDYVMLFKGNWLMLAFPITLACIGLLGLWGYIHSKPYGWHWPWELYLSIEVDKDVFAASLFIHNIITYPVLNAETAVAVRSLLSLLVGIPFIVALWRYIYRSPSVWRIRSI